MTKDEPEQGFASMLINLLKAGANSPANAAGIARMATESVVETLADTARGSTSSATDLARVLGSGQPVSGVVDAQVEAVRATAARLVGVSGASAPAAGGDSRDRLRTRGRDLLRLSYSPVFQPRGDHPAFGRILEDLTPDEARILRFLAVVGPQPAIDIRTKRLFGVGSVLLAANHSMVAQMAGCINKDQDLDYLANLERLGLVKFSSEPVLDPRRYSLIEVQPRSMEPLFHSGRKAVSIYRRIELTSFGRRFCDYCFGDDPSYTAGGWAEDPRGDVIYVSKRRKKKLAKKAAGGHGH